MYDIISRFMDKFTPQDIKDFASKNNIDFNEDEINFVYAFLKKNWEEILANPNLLILDHYRSHFSPENYDKIKNLVDYYRSQYTSNLKR
jgi:hypothetical protein